MLQGSYSRHRVKVQAVFAAYPPSLQWNPGCASGLHFLHASPCLGVVPSAGFRMEAVFNAGTGLYRRLPYAYKIIKFFLTRSVSQQEKMRGNQLLCTVSSFVPCFRSKKHPQVLEGTPPEALPSASGAATPSL